MSRTIEFYHGTSKEGADGILHEGAAPSKFGMLGAGFYSTDIPQVASSYARRGGEVLRGTVEGRIKQFQDIGEVDSYLESHKVPRGRIHELSKLLRKEGYDGVYHRPARTMVSFKRGSFHPEAIQDGQNWTDLT